MLLLLLLLLLVDEAVDDTLVEESVALQGLVLLLKHLAVEDEPDDLVGQDLLDQRVFKRPAEKS